MAEPGSKRAALRGAIDATRSRRRMLWLSVALGTGALLAGGGLLVTSGYLVSRAAQQPEIILLTVAIVGVRFFGISRAILRYFERLVSHDLAFRTLTDLRVRFFRRLVPLVPAGLPGRRADLLSRFVADADRLQDLYLRALAPPLVAVLAGTCALVVAGLMLPAAVPVLALILIAAGLGVPLLARRVARRAGSRQAAARARLTETMVAIAGSAPEIAVAGRESAWAERAGRDSAELNRLLRRDALAGGIVTGAGAALAAIAMTALAAVGVPAVSSGQMAGVLLAALVLLGMASLEAVTPLGAAAANIDAVAAAAERLEEVTERPDPAPPAAEPLPLPPGGALACHGVAFAYPGGGEGPLRSVDLELEPGRAVALVGPSGTGKSTLAELLVRFREPSEGSITLGGTDIALLDPDELRRAVRIAPQDAWVFTSSIRQNVALARPGATDLEIEEALRRAGLGPWLESLATAVPAGSDRPGDTGPEGVLHTEVGEGGAAISGGQRQRIAAARLFLAHARFLIWDEPTTHLDPDGAAQLLAEIRLAAERDGRGVLVITHEREGLDGFGVLELRDGVSRAPGGQGSRRAWRSAES